MFPAPSRLILVFALALSLIVPCQGQKPAMTNADVISLTEAGIAPDIIVTKIKSSPSKSFDTSVEALKTLKAAGVSKDVIVVMVTGGAPASSDPGVSTSGSTNDLKEPVFKEGLWEERTTTTTRAGDKPSDPDPEQVEFACHSHAHDHAEFKQFLNGGGVDRSHDSSSRGIRTSSEEPEVKCKTIRAAVEEGKQIVEQQCQVHEMNTSMNMSMKMAWLMADEDHMRAEADITYSPAIAGISHMTTVQNMTFKGPCPAGVNPGDRVDDATPAYQKKSKKH